MATTTIKDGFNGGSDSQLLVNPDGSINTSGTSTVTGSVTVTNFPATQAVSGTVIAQIEDSAGNPLTSTAGALNVSSTGSSTVSGTVNTNLNGLPAFFTRQVTVGTSPVQLDSTPDTNRSSISIKCGANNTAVVYIGNSSGVTTSNGYFLSAGDSVQLDVTSATSIYGISTIPNQLVCVLEIG